MPSQSPLDFLDFVPDLASPSIVATYDELPLWSAMFGLLLLEHVPLSGCRTVLDIGCGTGFPLIELAERLGPACQVDGVDTWEQALGRAADKIASRCVRNIQLHRASAAAMPFSDSRFDLIVSNLGLNNFQDAAAAVKECRRVAAPSAVLALTTNLQGHMREFYAVFEAVLDHAGVAANAARLREHEAHRATVAGTTELLDSHGFSVTRVVERTATWRFRNGTAFLNHHFIKLGFLPAWKDVVSGDRRDVFDTLRHALDALAEREGGLTLTIPMAYIEGRVVGQAPHR